MRLGSTRMTIGRNITPTLKLIRELGRGGMGTVWEALDLTLDSKVAVKMLDRAYAADEKSVKRFKDEAQRAARLTNPHITKVSGYGVTSQNEPYIVMELLEGESLGRCIKRCRVLPADDVASIIEQAARGLTAAHNKDLVHRDIKPDNLFVQDNIGQLFVKILDFGISKKMELPPDWTARTQTGALLGSPAYMSPEQYTHPKDVNHKTDLWSLGVVAYEAMTGDRPFAGSTILNLGSAISEGAFRPPTTIVADLPRAVDEWMHKALAKKPENRFGSAMEMANALMAIVNPTSRRSYPTFFPFVSEESGSFLAPKQISVKPEPDDGEAQSVTTTLVDHRPSSKPPVKAKRNDVKTTPFPKERAPLLMSRTFDAATVARIELGILPHSDDDQWFVFTERNHVFFHKYPTGNPVYEVVLENAPSGGKRVAQAWVAANKKATNNAASLVSVLDELFFDGPSSAPHSVRGNALQPQNPIWIYEGDLTTLTVDAIVCSTDPTLLGGMGIDRIIHKMAGSGLLSECKALGECRVGEAKITKGHSLPVKQVIHTVGPTWRGGLFNERGKLAACYANCLAMAANASLRTIAFPSISTGSKQFPLEEAAAIAAQTTLDFFARKSSVELVIFCTFSPEHTKAARAGLRSVRGA